MSNLGLRQTTERKLQLVLPPIQGDAAQASWQAPVQVLSDLPLEALDSGH